MTRNIYDECHGHDYDEPEEGPVCSSCGWYIFRGGLYFEVNDASGHDVICERCLKRMRISDLAELFGAELKKVR